MRWPEQLNFIPNARKKQHQTDTRIDNQIIVITGATSGVGLETAKMALANGAVVVMVIRNKKKAEQIIASSLSEYKDKIDLIIADFSNFDMVKKAARTLKESYDSIDVLVNSAGIYRTKKHLLDNGYEEVITVNHLSSLLFTVECLNLHPKRIINVSSEGHRFGNFSLKDPYFNHRIYTGLRSYGSSKTAQIHTVYALAPLLKRNGCTINAVHPGEVKSNIGMNNGIVYRTFKKLFINPFLKSPTISGQGIYYHIASPNMADITGKFYHLTHEELPAKHARPQERSHDILVWSLKQVGLVKEDIKWLKS